ncbi:MAG: acyltransferase, partial [Actinobacteria bacterium]|nr:acyltransferase [Actinomycetota bacterium]
MSAETAISRAKDNEMKYRKDVDGLRGIAVLAVVANHAAPDLRIFEGGFIGVDVFFVISGYLITTIILNNLTENNFSFQDFWARRIRRILPSLILMLAVMMPILYFGFTPYLRRELLKHTVAASSFSSNFSSIGEADYFGAQVLNPLLHLWSLAI